MHHPDLALALENLQYQPSVPASSRSCGVPGCPTYASLTSGTPAIPVLTKGVHPKIVQELLGHSSIAITLDTYSHVIPGMDGGTAGALEDALGD
jgi:hypothetical protein